MRLIFISKNISDKVCNKKLSIPVIFAFESKWFFLLKYTSTCNILKHCYQSIRKNETWRFQRFTSWIRAYFNEEIIDIH